MRTAAIRSTSCGKLRRQPRNYTTLQHHAKCIVVIPAYRSDYARQIYQQRCTCHLYSFTRDLKARVCDHVRPNTASVCLSDLIVARALSSTRGISRPCARGCSRHLRQMMAAAARAARGDRVSICVDVGGTFMAIGSALDAHTDIARSSDT